MSILIAFGIPYFCYIPHRVRAGGGGGGGGGGAPFFFYIPPGAGGGGGGGGGEGVPFLNARYRENLIIATEQMQ